MIDKKEANFYSREKLSKTIENYIYWLKNYSKSIYLWLKISSDEKVGWKLDYFRQFRWKNIYKWF